MYTGTSGSINSLKAPFQGGNKMKLPSEWTTWESHINQDERETDWCKRQEQCIYSIASINEIQNGKRKG